MTGAEQPRDLTEKEGGDISPCVTASAAPGNNRGKQGAAGQTIYKLSFP